VTPQAEDIGAKLRSSARYLPSTFEERGTFVPFTTPLLAGARVRKNYRHLLELCVPGFSEAKGHYIVPWTAVHELTQLTLHDRMLHEHVLQKRVSTPYAMRLAVIAVASTGLAGPAVAAAAAKAIAEDEEMKAVNHVLLILRFLQENGKSEAASLHDLAATNRRDRVRKALFATASDLGLPADELDNRLAALALMTYSAGVAWAPQPGRLRALAKTLTEMRDDMRAWGTAQISEAGPMALFAAAVIDMSVGIGDTLLRKFDAAMKSPTSVIANWAATKAEPEQLTDRLSWLLDGWEGIVPWWQGCRTDEARAGAVARMLPSLPIVPRLEMDPTGREELDLLVETGRRLVRLHHDWLTGEPDTDVIARIEAVKARAL
jgi:hypothetical protein